MTSPRFLHPATPWGVRLALAVLLPSCAPEGAQDVAQGAAPDEGTRAERPVSAGPDILLVTLDTLRADRVGAYGDPLAHTPTLDGLAAEGVLFREVMAAAPTTLPAHASMFTGRWPRGHGARDNAGHVLAPEVDTLAEALTRAGYTTGAFVSASVLDPATGLDQGYSRYSAPQDDGSVLGGAAERPSAETVALALAWWESTPGPRFLWVHLYDPHRPWITDAPDADPYRAEVSAADRTLGSLLTGLSPSEGAARPLVIAVAGDHGESLWEHGERDHGLLTSRAALRVPLIIRPPVPLAGADAPSPLPGGPLDVRRPPGADPALDLSPVPDAPRAARVVETPASGVDIAPTLADYAGVPFPSTGAIDGRSLRPLIEGTALPAAVVYAESWYPALSFGWAPRCAILDGDQRWTSGAGGATYRWRTDPGEVHPGPDVPALAAEATARGCLDRPAAASSVADPRLEALGYLEGAGELPDGDMDAVAALMAAEEQPDPDKAVAAYTALLARHPRLWRARSGLAVLLAARGDLPGALAQLDTPGTPDTVGLQTERAALQLGLHDLDGAEATAHHLQALAPRDPAGWRLLTSVATRRGDADGVERAAREGLSRRPGDPPLLYALGVALSTRKADAEALEQLSAAKTAGATARDLDLQIALLHDRAGRIDAAGESYAAYRAGAEGDFRAWAAPAWMYNRTGRCADALPLAEHALTLRPDDAGMRKVVSACAIRR